MKASEIGLSDTLDLVQQLMHDITVGPWLLHYLYPDVVEKRETQKRVANQKMQFGRLLKFIKPKDEKEARFLELLKKEVHSDGT